MGKKKGRGGGGGGGGGGENAAAAAALAPEVAAAAASLEPKKGDSGETKSDAAAATIAVLKVDMHCEGCAKKIRKSIKGFEGVEGVKVEVGSGRLTVVGRMDPRKLRERVETKTKKKVELVSPSNPPKKENNEASAPNSCSPKPDSKSASQKPGDKNTPKDKLPVVGTVVMKIPLHCDGCIHRIRKTILKIKGVEQLLIDKEKDHVTVKGTMDVKALPEVARAKLKRPVEVVAPKKDEAAREKNGKKDERKEEKAAVAAAAAEAIAAAMAEANGMDRCQGCGYTVELVYAPQIFSDENPNACSLM